MINKKLNHYTVTWNGVIIEEILLTCGELDYEQKDVN